MIYKMGKIRSQRVESVGVSPAVSSRHWQPSRLEYCSFNQISLTRVFLFVIAAEALLIRKVVAGEVGRSGVSGGAPVMNMP